ncbi:hypothetical protein HYU17_00590 [Candidatus Woesearchaeota archaeon]|nr:hypothetical protein [Candidatus Woesearchaeota archaeon]
MVLRRKNAALSIETVAVAAVVLVVILIVIAIFKGGVGNIMGSVNKVNQCEPKYKCVQGGANPSQCPDGQEIKGLGCTGQLYCCVIREENNE